MNGINEQKVIQRLLDLGHFYNPLHYYDVTQDDLSKFTLRSKEVKHALASLQDFMVYDFDRLSAQQHNRMGVPDGEIGPATLQLLDEPRCGCPDYAKDDFTLETGSGSWPVGCHKDWPNNHAFVVQVNKSGMPSFLGSRTDNNSVFERAFQLQRLAYADMGIVYVREDTNNRAHTLVTFQRGRGWIGLAVVPRNPRCGDRIWAKFDTVYSPRDLLNQWARLLAHEFGHNMGMSHFRGGIMNPSIVGGVFRPTAWRGDPAEAILRRWFGGVPVNVDGDDGDDGDDGGSGKKFTDEGGSIYG